MDDAQCCSGYCAETTCATRPVATNTPTSIPCDVDMNNVCNTPNPDCLSACRYCDLDYVGARKKSGWVSIGSSNQCRFFAITAI